MNKAKVIKDQTAAMTTLSPQAKRYDAAFKQQAVEHWLKSDQPGTQIAAELGISYPSLKDWKRRYSGDAVPERANPVAENRALKAELARGHEQRDILKKRWASSPNHRRALPTRRSHESGPCDCLTVRRVGGDDLGLPCLGAGGAQRPPAAGRGPAAAD